MQLRTFGGLAVQADDGPVEGAGAQKRRLALLALVDAAGDRGISRDKLVAYLWSESETEKARASLAQALYALRKALQSEDLFLGTNEVRLNRDILDSDRTRFVAAMKAGRLDEAVSHYAGPYLDGFYLAEAPEFEQWAESERASLAHDYVAALQKLAIRAETSGDPSAAVGWWRRLVNVDPLNGQLALGLMRAMVAAGDRAGALNHARLYERLVEQELDVPGDPDVLALAEELKRPASPTTPRTPASIVPASGSANAPRDSMSPAIPPVIRRSLAEQLSTAEVVAVAMNRLKSSRSALSSFVVTNHEAERLRGGAKPTLPGPARTLAAVQARFPTDRYVIEREIGMGGMASVFLAHDVRHDREVAIKVLDEEIGAALGQERFLREIKTTAKLQHPHILPLLDSGAIAGDGQSAGALLFYVMPYISGETLRDRLNREKQLPLEDALRIARDVAEALGYAHGRQIVHRDIKPENILLQGDHALVADFGIALAVETAGGPRVTRAGLSMGTPEYMAPEQAMGSPAIDHRADLYALGVVTYEMLTGDLPFTGATPQSIVAKMLTERPVSPRIVRQSVPPGVEAAVLTALAKVPADRFSQAVEFSRALAGGLTSGAQPTVWRPRSRATLSLAIGAIAIALLVIAGVALWDRGSSPLVMGTVTQVTRSRDTLSFDAAISPDGKLVAYASGPAGHMRLFLRQISGSSPVPIATGLNGDHRWPRWSPDGSKLAFVADEAIHVIPALGGTPQLVAKLGDVDGRPSWSPDGTQLAYFDSGGISTVALTGGPPRRVTRTLEAHSPVWSPDGRRIAYVVENAVFLGSVTYGNAATSSIWTASATGGDSVLITDAAHLNTAPMWWPDGRSILFVSDRDGTRDVYRQAVSGNGRPRGKADRITTGLNVFTFTLTRDGSQMAYATLQLRSRIWMASIPERGMIASSSAHPVTNEKQSIEGIALSHDGKWLAYDSDRNGNLDIFKIPFNGSGAAGDPVALTTNPAPDFEPRWSPNDDALVFYSRRLGTRDVYTVRADGRGESRVTSMPGNEYYPDWSPDGKRIVFSSQVTFAWQVFLTTRTGDSAWSAPVRLDSLSQPRVNVRWSPDGRSVALVRGTTLGLLSADGGTFTPVIDAKTLGETITFVDWGRDADKVFFQTRDSASIYSYWVVPTAGGPARRLLRLDEPGRRTRRVEFDTDGRNLFFTLVDDEADVAVVGLRRP